MDNNYSLSDIAALMKNGGFGNGDGLAWLILILLFLVGFGGFRGGAGTAGPAPMVPPNVATTDFVQQAVNNQTVNGQLQQIALSSANNNYETAQLVNGQTNVLMQQNYTNQINAIQGFNSVNQTLQGGFDNLAQQMNAQTNQLASQLNQIGYQIDRCCCDVKTTLLQQQLDDAKQKLADAKNQQSAMQAANYVLNSQGRYVAWEGSGTATQSAVG